MKTEALKVGSDLTCKKDEHNCGCPETSVNGDLAEGTCLCKPKSVLCDGILDCSPIQFYSDEGPEICG